jgi:hypothetical protein
LPLFRHDIEQSYEKTIGGNRCARKGTAPLPLFNNLL